MYQTGFLIPQVNQNNLMTWVVMNMEMSTNYMCNHMLQSHGKTHPFKVFAWLGFFGYIWFYPHYSGLLLSMCWTIILVKMKLLWKWWVNKSQWYNAQTLRYIHANTVENKTLRIFTCQYIVQAYPSKNCWEMLFMMTTTMTMAMETTQSIDKKLHW